MGTERLRSAVATGRATVQLARAAQLSLLAAAIAYYAFVSAVPLVVLAVLLATTLGGAALADQVVAGVAGFLEPSGEALLRSAVTARTGAGGVTALGLLVLVWGALKAFRALDRAFAVVYGTEADASLGGTLRDATVALAAVGLAAGATLLAAAAVSRLASPAGGLLGSLALAPALLVVFFPLYYVLPDVEVGVAAALPGAVAVSVGWAALSAGFAVYATTVAGASLYGLLGAVLLLLTWLYLGALLLLLGAALNAVVAGHGIGTYNAPAGQDPGE